MKVEGGRIGGKLEDKKKGITAAAQFIYYRGKRARDLETFVNREVQLSISRNK